MLLFVTLSVSDNNFGGLGSLGNLALDCDLHTFSSFARDAAYSLLNDAFWGFNTIDADQFGLEDYISLAGHPA